MWCPEGYYSWNAVLNKLFETSRQVLSLASIGGKPRSTLNGRPFLAHTAEFYLKNEGFAEDYEDAELIVGVTTTFLLANFLMEFTPVLSGLNGNKVLLSDDVLLGHRDQFELCYFSWPIKQDPQFLNLFEYGKTGKFTTSNLLDRFAFINPNTGEIRVKNSSREYLINGLGGDEPEVTDMLEFAKKLSGFVICWPDFPNDQAYRDFLNCLEANDDFVKALDYEYGSGSDMRPIPKKRAVGRPSKKDEAARSYWTHFPDGHEAFGMSWKEALAVVNSGLKGPIHEDTLKRAISTAPQNR